MQALRSANLEVSDKCNLKCGFCYQNRVKKAKPMSTKQLMKAIDIISTLPRMKNEFRLGLIGGEPLFNPDLAQLCKYAAEKLGPPTIITNGTLATREKLKQLRPFIHSLQVSILAPFTGLHDDLVGHVPGAWAKAIKCLEWCALMGINRVITFTITRTNFNYLKDMIALSFKLKSELKILHMLPYRPEDRIQAITPKQNEYLCRTIEKHGLISDSPLASIITGKQQICDSGINRVCIRSSGDCSPCDFIPQTFGNIFKEDIGAIMQRMAAWRDARYPMNKNACRVCKSFQRCLSGCIANQIVYEKYRDQGCWL